MSPWPWCATTKERPLWPPPSHTRARAHPHAHTPAPASLLAPGIARALAHPARLIPRLRLCSKTTAKIRSDGTKQLRELPHSKARQTPYQGGTERFVVPDGKIAWKTKWPAYEPVEFTHAVVLKGPPWADKPDVSSVEFNVLDMKARIDRCSFEGKYATNAGSNRPLCVCVARRAPYRARAPARSGSCAVLQPPRATDATCSRLACAVPALGTRGGGPA